MKRFVLLLLVCAAAGAAGYIALSRQGHGRSNVIVILLDTLRADHLGYHGYQRATSPNLDRFAAENRAFKYAVTAAPWTPPSVATIFTGLYPSSHGWMPPNNRNKVADKNWSLNPALLTLAEILDAQGYATAAISPNPWITPEFGYDQGFKSFRLKSRAPAADITKIAKEELAKLKDGDNPFFLYIHYLDPHDPYKPPAPYNTEFTGPVPGTRAYDEKMTADINLYDGEIKYLDASLGDLFGYLKQEGLYDSTAIIVVADHGEQFKERGDTGHGHQLFNEEVNVPLIVKSADGSVKGTIEETVGTIDVFPTVLELTGITPAQNIPGVSLLHPEKLKNREGVFSEIAKRYQQRAFVTPAGRKLIVRQEKGALPGDPSEVVGLYDRTADYLETAPVDDQVAQENIMRELSRTYQLAYDDRVAPTDTMKGRLKDSTVEQLKSLGYLQ